MEVVLQSIRIEVDMLRTYQQQRVASLQHHVSRCLIDTLTASGYSCQHHIVILLKRTAADGRTYQTATEGDVCRVQSIIVYLVDREDMVVGTHQLVGRRYINQLINASGIDQMVTTHDRLVLHDG